MLLDWHGRQILERAEWDTGWQDTGFVFTREDGRPVRTGLMPRRSPPSFPARAPFESSRSHREMKMITEKEAATTPDMGNG